MQLCFLVPPCYDNKQPAERSAGCTRIVYPMINIYELTAAAVVRDMGGHEVEYHDFVFEHKSIDDFKAFLQADSSEAYLIWAVNLSIDSDLQALADIRAYHKDTPVIFMGPGATYFTQKCLIDKNVYVVRGEPEMTLLQLVDTLASGGDVAEIQGLSYLCDGKVKHNPARPLIKDLDALPFPARDLLGDHEYHNSKLKTGPYTTLFTSRNCPFKCIYCVPSSLTFAREIEYKRDHDDHKPPIGFRSAGSVENEVAQLAAQGYKAIGFMDDNFIWNETRTREMCDIMRRYGMVWGCQARVDAITEPIAKMLSESGCRYVDLGIESFDDRILEYVNKGITTADIYRAVELLKKYGVPVKLNVLIGSSPYETRETVLHTLHEAKKLDVDQVMFNIVSPFPATKFYKICKENGWLKDGEYRPSDVQRESTLNLPNISAEEMEQLLFRNNLSYFLSPRFVWKQLKRFSSWSEFVASAKALKMKLFH